VRPVLAVVLALAVVSARPAVVRAAWAPAGLVPTTAALADVLAANARAMGNDDARLAQRRERWTYAVGERRMTVAVAVRDDDYRTALDLDGLTYMAGRRGGAHWRADGNGVVHGVEADLQGDALDRAPQAVFHIDPATCTLVGETLGPRPAWVVETQRDGDKPAFLSIDETSGTIVREVLHDGRRTVTTTFDAFAPIDDRQRARHWHVSDGTRANELDVSVDAIEPGPVSSADVGYPVRRLFAPVTPLTRSTDIDAVFHHNSIQVRVDIGNERSLFDLDTGTASITVGSPIANRYGGATLEHAVLPRVRVGPLQLDRVSVLNVALPASWRIGGGILGLDFFFGHIVEIDYPRQRVRILSDDDARAALQNPALTWIDANVDQGLPLVHAAFGPAQGETFAIDTGSPRLYVMQPFMTRFADEIAHHWTPVGRPFVEHYLEGSVELQPYRVARFAFGNAGARDLIVGGQVPSALADGLTIPFDGIIGTDVLQNFDVYLDYDNGRLGVRRE
jgi:hypothetical protein